jgi:hypothetical protein
MRVHVGNTQSIAFCVPQKCLPFASVWGFDKIKISQELKIYKFVMMRKIKKVRMTKCPEAWREPFLYGKCMFLHRTVRAASMNSAGFALFCLQHLIFCEKKKKFMFSCTKCMRKIFYVKPSTCHLYWCGSIVICRDPCIWACVRAMVDVNLLMRTHTYTHSARRDDSRNWEERWRREEIYCV